MTKSPAEVLAQKFITDQVEEYDYDALKEFVFDKMFVGRVYREEDNDAYSALVSEVCDAMKKARVIVKFSGR